LVLQRHAYRNASFEKRKNSGAVLEHIADLGATLGEILGVCDMALELYGSPSPELVKAAAGLAPKIRSRASDRTLR
jgi:hypothetical protein